MHCTIIGKARLGHTHCCRVQRILGPDGKLMAIAICRPFLLFLTQDKPRMSNVVDCFSTLSKQQTLT